jgi:biotin carboxylase
LIVIHRWTDHYADYGAYVDHGTHRVGYVTTDRARGSLPAGAAGTRLVSDIENVKEVRAAVAALVARSGPPTRIIALHEVDQDIAAELRQEYGVPGQTPERLAPFRDKLVMAERLTAHGVPVPHTAPAPDHRAVADFAGRHGWPVVVKPARGTASAHVVRLDSRADLDGYAFPADVPMLVQPYLPHEVLHVDGVAAGGALLTWRASRYLNTCLDFTAGAALGSVELDDPRLLAEIGPLTERAVRALTDEPLVFHLELLHDGGTDPAGLTVLEIAARAGGAEVPFVWREVHGIDLMAAAFAIQAGTPLPSFVTATGPRPPYGGWLLVPPGVARPCRVRSAPPQTGLPGGPYAERIPLPGATLPDLAGYEHSGARFRFRGASTAEVTDAVLGTRARFEFGCAPVDRDLPGRVIVVGSGGRPYREYAFAAAAERADLALVSATEPDWQLRHVGGHRCADLTDPEAAARAVAGCALGHPGPVGVLTWDETLLRTTAEVAGRLGLPHLSPAAVDGCRDKLTTRRELLAAGIASAAFRHVRGEREALAAAEEIGYPVVLKPRALAGSAGVVLARDAAELADRFHHVEEAAFPGIDPLEGLIVEEYLDGPEISADSVVVDGVVHLVNVARKELGYPPFFEEVGHTVAPWRHEPWADALREMVEQAHEAVGVWSGVTHAELRLTARGPRLVELNGRLGGDFIPYLGRLATGVDQTAAAVDLALGIRPDLRERRAGCAAVRFVYPERDGVVRSLDLGNAGRVPGVVEAVALAAPGQRLLLPPRGVVPRLAAVIATGPTPAACRTAIDRAVREITAEITPSQPSE